MTETPLREEIIQEYYAANPALLVAEELKSLGYNLEKISPESIVITNKTEYTHFLENNIQDICAANAMIREESVKELTSKQIKEAISKGHVLPIEFREEILAEKGKSLFIERNPNHLLQEDLQQMIPDFNPDNHKIEINGYEEVNRKAENLFLDKKLSVMKYSSLENVREGNKLNEETKIILKFALENMSKNPALIRKAIDSLIKNNPKNKQLKQAISNYLVDYSNKLISIPHAFNQAAEIDQFIDQLNSKKTDYVFAKLSKRSKEKLSNLSSLLQSKDRASSIAEANISAVEIRKLNQLDQELKNENIPEKTRLAINGLVAYTNSKYLTKQAELANIAEINNFANIAYQNKAFIQYGDYKSSNHVKERFAHIAASRILNDESPEATENFHQFLDQKPQLGDIFAPEHENNLVKKTLDLALAKASTDPNILRKTVKLIKEQNPHDTGFPPMLKVLSIAQNKFPDNKDLEKIYNVGDLEKLSKFIIKNNLISEVAEALGEESLNKKNILDKLHAIANKGSVVGEVADYLLSQSNYNQHPQARRGINQVLANELQETLSIGSEPEINEIYNQAFQTGNQELADLIQVSNPGMKIQATEIEPEKEDLLTSNKERSNIKPKSWTIRGAAHKTVKTLGLSSGPLQNRKPEDRNIIERGAHRVAKRFKENSLKLKKVARPNNQQEITAEKKKPEKPGIIKRGTHKAAKRIKEQGYKFKDNIMPNQLSKELDQLEIVAKEKDVSRSPKKTKQEQPKPILIIPNSMYLTQRYCEEILNISEKHSGIKDVKTRKEAIDQDISGFLDNVISSTKQRIKDRDSKTRKQEVDKVKESKSIREIARNVSNIDLNKVIGTNRSSTRKHDKEVIKAAKIFKSKKNIEGVIAKAEKDVVRKISKLKDIPNVNKQDEIKRIKAESDFNKYSKEISHNYEQISKDTFWKKFSNFCENIGATPFAKKFEELNMRRQEKLKPKREQVFKAQATNLLIKLGVKEKSAEVADSVLSKREADRRTIEERIKGGTHNIGKHTMGSSQTIDPTKEKITKAGFQRPEFVTEAYSNSISPPLTPTTNRGAKASVQSK